ncbi:MAG: ChrR family anti-sigma-E factor [Pseudomonadota bacterium]
MCDNIKHHLSDELLMGYAAGSWPEAFNLVIATHIAMCAECRFRLAEFETVGGAMLESDVGAVDLSSGAFEATFSRIANAAWPDEPKRAIKVGAIFPAPLQDYMGGDLEAVKWRPIGMGVGQAVLKTSKEASARLLKIPAGCEMPDHGHRGTELTLVLKGAFLDEGNRFVRGDIGLANEEVAHTPVADVGEDCICLAATDAPLRFNRLLPRIVQPFIGI